MASRNPLLPTLEQCMALTTAQCQMIQECMDPHRQRNQRNWAPEHQVELIRQYMTMRSFPVIEKAMKPNLVWSYKTYSHRYADWGFPVNRIDREQTVVSLYARVTGTVHPNSFPGTSHPPHPPHTLHTPSMLDRKLQSHPSTSQSGSASPMTVSSDFFLSTSMPTVMKRSPTLDRMSIASNTSWTSNSTSTLPYYDDTFSTHRLSVATTNSSISARSQTSIPKSQPPQRRPLESPKHDPYTGTWNRVLRVIPCGQDHSHLLWHDMLMDCAICGFSPIHALMIHARELDLSSLFAATRKLVDIEKLDFAGNHPIHFLMSAGVGMEYYMQFLQWTENSAQNSFGQNPLHVTDPRDLGDSLITLLEWFKKSHNPPGLLHTQRDIYCRTPLHALLQYPLERNLYQRILKCFIYAEHQLRSFDTSGRTAIKMMNKASLKAKSDSYLDYAKIQVGITETKLFLSAIEHNPTSSSHHLYGFHDIARGARGNSYMGSNFFQCRICNLTNAHSNSYRDQMECACKSGRDRNGPDETGMTPAHAIVTQIRSNANPEPKPETAVETAELFRVLIPSEDHTLREALHVLDPEGNSLIYNIATRGLDDILEYALALEHPSRRKAMVNTCGKEAKIQWSVLKAVMAKRAEMYRDIEMTDPRRDLYEYQSLCEKSNRLTRCKNLLLAAGAELDPSIMATWRIVYETPAIEPTIKEEAMVLM